MNLTLRNVEVDGRGGLDVRIEGGRIAEVAPRLARAPLEVDGRGGALIPGLADHHIHLFGLAARADSVVLEGATAARDVRARILSAVASKPAGGWVRILGYHEAMAGDLDRRELDALAPRHRLRMQHQTGSLWVLNSLALESVGAEAGPASVERDEDGRPTGRVWRGDAWLRGQIGAEAPALAPIGRQLAAFGVTALTDASVTTGADAAAQLAEAQRRGHLPQRLTLMSGGALEAPADDAFAVGPVKILLDDHALPDFDEVVRHIAQARAWDRAVAVHCVTAAELAFTLAVFDAAGARSGDRIEHGGVIPEGAIHRLKALDLTVVTQPAFIAERGDRYVANVPPAEQQDLYRCASLRAAGVPVAASSDAPYATPDPWAGIAAAIGRRTAAGLTLGAAERVTPAAAMSLYLDDAAAPGRRPRRVAVGAVADLCLLNTSLKGALAAPDAGLVRATLVGGRPVHETD
jgi:predicted amidohydrolase YtcJ